MPGVSKNASAAVAEPECQKIQKRHREIIRLVALGMSHREAAEACGTTKETVNNLMKLPINRRHLEEIQAKRDEMAATMQGDVQDVLGVRSGPGGARSIRSKISKLSDVATEIVQAIMQSDVASPAVKLKAAFGVLDRDGYGPVKTIQSAHLHGYLSKDDIEELTRRAREANVLVIEPDEKPKAAPGSAEDGGNGKNQVELAGQVEATGSG